MPEETKTNNITKPDAINFDEFPDAVKKQIATFIGLFVFGGLIMMIFFVLAGAISMWYLPALIIAAGIYYILQLYSITAKGELKEIEGVVIDTDSGGYRRQNHFIFLQDTKGNVYRILVTKHKKHYKIGDIVRFYSTLDSLMYINDGIHEVRAVYASERLTAKMTTDEEDNMLKNMSEEKTD